MTVGFRLFLLLVVVFGALWVYHLREGEVAAWLGLGSTPPSDGASVDLHRSPLERVYSPKTEITIQIQGQAPEVRPEPPWSRALLSPGSLYASDPAQAQSALLAPEIGALESGEGELLPPYEEFEPEVVAPPEGPSAEAPVADAPAPTPPEEVFITHTVVKGDKLWKLAERYLGAGHRYKRIVELNAGVLGGTEELKVGMELRIPQKP